MIEPQFPSGWRPGLIAVPPVQLALFDDLPRGPGVVYAAWRQGWVKVGYTVDIGRRMRELRADLLGHTEQGQTKRDELKVHMALRPWAMAHEWYNPSAPVIAWVLSLPHLIRLPHEHPWPPSPPPVVRLAA